MIAAAGVAAACLVGSAVAAPPASAQVAGTTLYASATGTGDCSTSANACTLSTALGEVAAGGTIDLVTPGTTAHYDGNFTVGTTDTSASAPVTIQAAPGVTDPTLDGTNSGTVLTINSGVYVDLSGITITGGNTASGGGIFNSGTVTVTDSTISGNTAFAQGGGINNTGTVTVTGSTISGNTATTANSGFGGGIFNVGGTVTVTDSTISGNTAFAGSGIYNDGTVTVTDSTISGNTASFGGDIYNGGTVTVTDVDLAITTPKNITTSATGANGATVDYTVPTATDEGSTPTVTCSAPSGSTFPVGTTTVTCKASSSDDANSPVSASFTVTVEGAAAQLSDLASAVQGVGPGKSLAEKVHAAQSSLAAGNIGQTCSTLGAFIHEVRAQAGKKIGSSQARQLIADAQRIQAVLSCQGDQHHGS